MYPTQHERLLADTEALRKMLSAYSTETIVGMCNVRLYQWFGDGIKPSPLVSPMREVFFLLGLMLTTEEPDPAQQFGDEEFSSAIPLLNDVFSSYALMYWPEAGVLDSMPQEWRHRREVAMVAFLHHFNTILTASLQQMRDRTRRYLCPFDAELTALNGISASGCIDLADWMVHSFQDTADRLVDAASAEREARRRLLAQAQSERWGLDRTAQEARSGEYAPIGQAMIDLLFSYMKVGVAALEAEFGESPARAFWRRFVSERGSSPDFTYLTESNPAEDKPLILLPDGRAMCPSPNFVYTAVLGGLERDILASPARDRFLTHRDKALEDEVASEFGRLFPSNSMFRNLYETGDLQYEHDLLILWDSAVLSIECKASPPREPFRDPEKAFVRIRDDFTSKRGVQGAYDQASRIPSRVLAGDEVPLFDVSRKQVVSIDPRTVTRAFSVCVTRDSFGPLTVDLSLLLEKPTAAPYPWAINVMDLAYLLDTWTYFHWGPDELLRFLSQRIRIHGRVTSFDELEVAGFFIEHGGLDPLISLEADHILLGIDYSDVFDRVYAVGLGGPPPSLAPTEPHFSFPAPRVAVVAPK